MHKTFTLNKIRPNPHRNMARYPIHRKKVEALKTSYRKTGFWGNIVAREVGGFAEIAYGHHRLVALQEEMTPRAKVDLIVRKLDASDMLKMMADENMHEYRTSAEVEQETVRAVVDAYAAGEIELEKPGSTKARNTRYAPSFRVDFAFKDDKRKPYNAESIAEFLGWMSGKQVAPCVRNALTALELAEELDAEDEMVEIARGLSTEQSKVVVAAVKEVKKAHQVAGRNEEVATQKGLAAGKKIAEQARKGSSVREIREQATLYKPAKQQQADREQTIEEYVELIAGDIDAFFHGDDTSKGFAELMKYKAYIGPSDQTRLVKILYRLASRCEQAIGQLEGTTVGTKFKALEN